jgi:hypothetical protein
MKHLQHTLEIAKTLVKHQKKLENTLYPLQTYTNNKMKHLQHTYKNTWNTCIYMQHPDLVLKHPNESIATYVWNRWNIWNIHLKHMCIAHYNMRNILIYFCNILMKHLQHTSKTSETLEMYNGNMHRISVQPPSSFASGRHSRSRMQGWRASVLGSDASPCATTSVASWRPREWSPLVGTAVPMPSGEVV